MHKRISSIKQSLWLTLSGIFMLLIGSAFSVSNNDPDAIVGVWKTGDGNAMVRIYKNGEKYQGKIVWLKEPIDPETGKPKLDKNHSDEASRKRPILGLINIWGFTQTEKNVWEEGNIYDPKNGSTYSCTIKMTNPKTLEVRGYIGVSLIGRTDVWTKQVAK
ncbi:MAG: hypothetical protein RLZ47_1442 [Bacteroidota bacterium]|jgi:uncharacterized protein (DUF2147 family)